MIYEATLYKTEDTRYSRGYWVCELNTEIPHSIMRANFIPREIWDRPYELFCFESDKPENAVAEMISRLKSFGISGYLD